MTSIGLVRHVVGAAAIELCPIADLVDAVLTACGRWTLAASGDGVLRLLDATGTTLERSTVESPPVAIALSEDRRIAATVDRRGSAAIWAFPNVERLAVLSGDVDAMAMSPSGATLALGGRDARLRIWSIEWSLDPTPPVDYEARIREVLASLGRDPTIADAVAALEAAGLGHGGEEAAAAALALARA